MRELACDVLVVGGGTGGVAAALAATALGCRVVLTEPTDWLGGQLTSQGVPPDEHPWIEQFGCTRRYRTWRDGVRDYYRRHYPLTAAALREPHLNPGQGSVSRLCCEPRVALAVIEALLAPARVRGLLTVLLEHEPLSAATAGDRVRAVTLRDRRGGETVTVSAPYILDATELGDLLALAGVEHVTGAESQAETGEAQAAAVAQPDNQQAITWCLAMGYDPAGEHVIEPPPSYAHWRDDRPAITPAWPGPLLGWAGVHPATLETRRYTLFGDPADASAYPLWIYRRIVGAAVWEPAAQPQEATLVNWPQNDYLEAPLTDATPEQVADRLQAARELSLGLLYWLQTEAPRPDGGVGYPGLYPAGDLLGTADGLAKAPYIRESRRIRAEVCVTEAHIGAAMRAGRPAEPFADSVGIGSYRIDLHPSTGGDNYLDISSLPFQIPLGALLPVRVENLLPACKNLGVTHLTNGCYRLHPVEWNIGEAAGLLAAFCLQRGEPPRAVRARPALLSEFQALLRGQGVELHWPQVTAR
ncbi:MAG: FAD-dependent oxidoreductase [Fimbriimonadaceae bacterium]|nr:FAD-dependent oxidoreductase [Fimbriimonadaceae bacterium]